MDLKGKLNAALGKAKSLGDGPNRGDRMAARGEKKIEKATVKLGNQFYEKAVKLNNKFSRVANRAGEYPTLGQSKKLDSLDEKFIPANQNRLMYNTPNRDKLAVNYNQHLVAGGYGGDASENAKSKAAKGQKLIDKGTMLSSRIINKRKG